VVPVKKQPVEERFWSKVSGDSYESCWLWVGGLHPDGYGIFYLNNMPRRAHRIGYELMVGPIPDGLQLDHLCRVRHCVNPWHLEPVTNRVNSLRGAGPTLARARGFSKTHCKYGHPLSGVNVSVNAKGYRTCLTCRRNYMRKKHPPRQVRQLGPLVRIVHQVGYRAELACGHTVVRTNGKGARRARCPECDRAFEPVEKGTAA
jgi:HNH endonuclease